MLLKVSHNGNTHHPNIFNIPCVTNKPHHTNVCSRTCYTQCHVFVNKGWPCHNGNSEQMLVSLGGQQHILHANALHHKDSKWHLFNWRIVLEASSNMGVMQGARGIDLRWERWYRSGRMLTTYTVWAPQWGWSLLYFLNWVAGSESMAR